jgi:hypothetical protein
LVNLLTGWSVVEWASCAMGQPSSSSCQSRWRCTGAINVSNLPRSGRRRCSWRSW